MHPAHLIDRAEALREEGQTVMFVAINGAPAGLVGVADPIKTIFVKASYLLSPGCLGAPGNPSSNGCGPPAPPPGFM